MSKSSRSWIGPACRRQVNNRLGKNAGGEPITEWIIYGAASGSVRCVIELHLLLETALNKLFDKITLRNFGDAMRIHHGFSAEPFSKDKYVMNGT